MINHRIKKAMTRFWDKGKYFSLHCFYFCAPFILRKKYLHFFHEEKTSMKCMYVYVIEFCCCCLQILKWLKFVHTCTVYKVKICSFKFLTLELHLILCTYEIDQLFIVLLKHELNIFYCIYKYKRIGYKFSQLG